jgi:hypothetical protein
MRALWGLLLLLSSVLVGGSSAPVVTEAAGVAAAPSSSYNWSGYVLSGPRGSVQGAQGSWVVQRVRPEPNDTYSSQWVGVDGFSSQDLIQTGTDSNSVGGTLSYGAWIDLAPNSAQTLPMKVDPGDVMAATVVKSKSDLWTITLADITRHEHYSTSVHYMTRDTSAEWIEERPMIGAGGVGVLANLSYFRVAEFGSRYTGSLSDSADVQRGINAPVATQLRSVQMLLTKGPAHLVALDKVGTLATDGASFMVTRTKPFASRGAPALPATVHGLAGASDCIFPGSH